MENQNTQLAKISFARQALIEAKTIIETKKIVDVAEAMALYTKKQNYSLAIQNDANVFYLEAQIQLGKILKTVPKNKGEKGRFKKTAGDTKVESPATYMEQGIKGRQAMDLQDLADNEVMVKEEIKKLEENNEPITASKIKTKVRKEKKKRERKKKSEKSASVVISDKLIDFRHGDFKKVLSDIPDHSIDLFICDPPYPHEFIECWSELSLFASQKLKDGGFCVAYSGQLFLPEVMKRMAEHLNYYWLCGLQHEGKIGQRFEVNLFNRMKPILIYQNGEKMKQENWGEDLFVSPKGDKEHHDWGQSVSPLLEIIDLFEPKTVCDPFVGGGSTIIACRMKGIKFIGSEIDEVAYNITKGRVEKWQHENDI